MLLTALTVTALALNSDQRALAASPQSSRGGEITYLACAIADLTTTGVGVHNGLREANPLMSGDTTGEVLLKATAIKAGVYGLLRATKAPQWVYYVMGTPQCLASINNTYQLKRRYDRLRNRPTVPPVGGPLYECP